MSGALFGPRGEEGEPVGFQEGDDEVEVKGALGADEGADAAIGSSKSAKPSNATGFGLDAGEAREPFRGTGEKEVDPEEAEEVKETGLRPGDGEAKAGEDGFALEAEGRGKPDEKSSPPKPCVEDEDEVEGLADLGVCVDWPLSPVSCIF